MRDLVAAAMEAKFSNGNVLNWAIGTVTATSPFTVQIHGDTVDIISPPRCSSYTPTTGDIVFVLRPAGSGFLVVSKII